MKKVCLLLLLGLMAFRCGHSPDPEPGVPLFMNAWVEYTTAPLALELRGMVFRSTNGPEERSFDKAEVYISEGQPVNLQLLTTTSQTSVPLTNLKAGTSYYVAVKGFLGNYTSEMSKPILVVPDVVQPVQKLLPYDPMATYLVSPSGQQAIRQYREATGNYVTQLINATGNSRVLTYANTEKNAFFSRAWTADNQQILFEVGRAGKRALIRYDSKANTFVDVPLPAEADLWNYSLAPDGQQIVFSDYKRPGLWHFNGLTKTQKQLDSQQTIYDLAWTADSRFVLLTKPEQGLPVVIQYDAQTNAQTQLLSGLTQVSGAKLSPDGNYFLFNSTLSGRSGVWLQDRQTRALRPVSNGSQFGWLSNGTFWTDYRVIDNKAPGERESFLWIAKP